MKSGKENRIEKAAMKIISRVRKTNAAMLQGPAYCNNGQHTPPTAFMLNRNRNNKNNENEVENAKSCLRKKIIKGAILFLMLISLIFYRDSLKEIWEGIRQVRAGELWMCLLLSAAGYVLEGITIYCMMGAVIPAPCIWEGIFIAYVCEFYRLTTLGNGSGVARIHYLCKCGKCSMRKRKFPGSMEGQDWREIQKGGEIAPGSAAVLTMIQYIMKRIAIMALGLLGFLVLCQKECTRRICREYGIFVSAGCLITAGIIAVFFSLALSENVTAVILHILKWLSGKIPSGKTVFQKGKEQIRFLNQSGKSILRQRKRMLCAVLIQVGKLLMFYGMIAYLFRDVTPPDTGICILLMALAFMLSGVIPAPSGAGALEFVYLLFFTQFVNTGMAVTAILVYRFATWIFPAAVGGILLAAGIER